MTATDVVGELYFDPYDQDTIRDPFPVSRRMRDEAPVYHNEELGFYALTRAEDVERALLDRETYISGKGVLLNMMRAGIAPPPGVIIMEDPPSHTIHRALLSRLFTPRAMAGMEDKIRQLCADLLDPLVGESRFDVIEQFSLIVPSAAICWLIGIPDEDQPRIRQHVRASRSEGHELSFAGTIFSEYYDYRLEHPSDDIMTHLMTTEFEDENGVRRTLARQEVLGYLAVVNGAGHDTTKLAIAWAAKILAENPDQRRLLVEDPSLIPGGFEEVLRYEAPTLQACRTTTRDVELHDRTIPAESIVALVGAAANRDERRFPDPDTFDVRRSGGQHHLSFGIGAHYCLGQALARLEGRVALQELLKRFPEWDVDMANAEFKQPSEARGWEKLPVVVR